MVTQVGTTSLGGDIDCKPQMLSISLHLEIEVLVKASLRWAHVGCILMAGEAFVKLGRDQGEDSR